MTGFVFIAFISYFVYVDALYLKKINQDLYLTQIQETPLRWAIGAFLLFILVVPIYIFRRSKFFKMEAAASLPSPLSPELNDEAHRVTQETGIIIIWFLVFSLISMAIYPSLLKRHHQFDFSQSLNLNFVQYLLFIAVVLALKGQKQKFRTMLHLETAQLRAPRFFLMPVVFGISAAALSAYSQLNRAEIPSTPLREALKSSGPESFMKFALIGALIAPFFEEVVYRGYIFDVLNKVKGKAFSIAAVSILFALLHFEQTYGDWRAAASIVALALALTCLRSWSGSVIPSVIAHYSYNISLLVVPVTILLCTNPSYVQYSFYRDKLPPEKRVALLKQSIIRQPKTWGAYNDLAWALAEENKELPEALKFIDQGLSGDPERPEYLDTKAEILFKLKRYAEAVEIEKVVVKKLPAEKFFLDQLQKFEKARSAQTSSGH